MTDKPQERPIEHSKAGMKTSRFEVVTSFLTALILFLVVPVSLLFTVWLLATSLLVLQPSTIEKVVSGTSSQGLEDDFEPPGQDEVQELLEPSLADSIAALTDAASSVSASLVSLPSNHSQKSDGASLGDRRSEGPGDEADDLIPIWKRWEIRFHAEDKDDYARQLDHFGIELASFGGGSNFIESASSFSTQAKRKINRKPETERRLYFSWKQNNLLSRFDQQLLASAGISSAGRNVIRFLPTELEARLAAMEEQHCRRNGKRFPSEIRKTVFESQPEGDGYRFIISSQRYR